MADHRPSQLRVADLQPAKPTPFEIAPDAAARAAIAAQMDLDALRKLRFRGEIAAVGGADWQLTAEIGATLVQPCGVTLAPVTTRVDEPLTRTYVRAFDMPEGGGEAEMPEDDTVEPIPDVIDLEALMLEALSLAIPAFPRAPDAELGAVVHTAAGTQAMTDEDAKPFAGLGALRDALAAKDKDGT